MLDPAGILERIGHSDAEKGTAFKKQKCSYKGIRTNGISVNILYYKRNAL